MVAQARMNVNETMGRKNNCELNFFSMYFVGNNEEIHFSFKNSVTSFKDDAVRYIATKIHRFEKFKKDRKLSIITMIT